MRAPDLDTRCRSGGLATLAVVLLSAFGLLATAGPAFAQTGTVTGQVTDAGTGSPMAGVQVSVVGTNRGSLTGADGAFTITGVSAGERELRAQSIGYRSATESVTVQDDAEVSVALELQQSAVALDEVIVTGTPGGTERRALGNVVSRVDAAETLERSPVPNVQSLLNARSPGTVIMPGTGMVGSGSKIRIRGSSSLSLSNDPLIYVDGVRVDNAQSTGPAVQAFGSNVVSRLNDFNPRDIESIEVIRGPAAATLYGTEASNGVIQIITKRGTAGTPSFNFTTRQGGNWFANAEQRIPTNFWRNPETQEIESINYATSERERGTPLFRTGHLQNYNLSVSGGAEGVRYYLAGDWEREEGAELDNDLRRGSGRANITIFPTDNVDVTGTMGYVASRTNLSLEAGGGGVTWSSYYSTPANNQMGPDGERDRRRGGRSLTPEAYYGIFENFQDIGRFTGSVQVNHRLSDWFTHRLTAGTDETSEDNQSITERSAQYQEWFPSGLGGKTVNRRDVSVNTLDYSGTIDVDLTDGLTSSTSFGTQYYRRFTDFVTATGSDFVTSGLRQITATADRNSFESFSENVTVGVFGQQQFSWQNRLFATVGLRADDNSAFGEEFSLIYYPKASATWVINEEPFWNVPVFNTLRLRAAYGVTGQQPGAFDALRTFSAQAGRGDVSTVSPGSVGNPALGPERAEELEFGLDAGFLNERLGLELTFYNSTTRDAILLQSVAPSTGFPGSRFVNIGEIANRGYEIALTGQPVTTPNLAWDFSVSLASNDSEVIDLGEEDRVVESAAFGVEHREGFPIGSWFHHRIVSADLDENGAHIKSSMMCDDAAGGTTACFDAGNNIIAPRVYLGRTNPPLEGAFNSTVTLFDRIQLFGLVDFKTGHRKWDSVLWVRCGLFNTCMENVDPTNGDFDPVTVASYQNSSAFGETYINDASFAKLRELSASFLVPSDWASRLGVSNARVTVAGRNLHTWSNWTGMEPEAMFLGGARGGFVQLEQNHLPQLTRFETTINFSF